MYDPCDSSYADLDGNDWIIFRQPSEDEIKKNKTLRLCPAPT